MPSAYSAARASGIKLSQQMSVPIRPIGVATACNEDPSP